MSTPDPLGSYCPVCDGTGTLAHLHSMDGGLSSVIAACPHCDDGVIRFPTCRRCGDTGYVQAMDPERFDRCTCSGPHMRGTGSRVELPQAPSPDPLDWRHGLAILVCLVVLAGAVVVALGRPA